MKTLNTDAFDDDTARLLWETEQAWRMFEADRHNGRFTVAEQADEMPEAA